MINITDILKAIINHLDATKTLYKNKAVNDVSYNKLININTDNLILIAYNKHENGYVAILKDITNSMMFEVEFYLDNDKTIFKVSSYGEIRKDKFLYNK